MHHSSLSSQEQNPHISVLAKEVLASFEGVNLRTLVDATAGAGGHSFALLQAHPEVEKLIAIDQDSSALVLARKRLEKWMDKVQLVHANFSRLKEVLEDVGQVDGILFDLGVSSMQLDQAERGFSFMRDAPLDMRMDPSQTLTAREIVNLWDEQELGRVLREYGEEKKWRLAARAIAAARETAPIESTGDLVRLLSPVLGRYSKKGIHPLTLVFQGLRLAVNRELEVLSEALPIAIAALNKGGRLAVISFHSLEDRIAKQLFAHNALDKADTSGLAGLFIAKEPIVKIVTRKPIVASEEEIKANPRSRSAKLRVVEKL